MLLVVCVDDRRHLASESQSKKDEPFNISNMKRRIRLVFNRNYVNAALRTGIRANGGEGDRHLLFH